MEQSMRERFIITADDYGIRETSKPILELAKAGKLDRVAVLINYVSQEEAEELLVTGVKVDLHLELIDHLKTGKQVYESALKRGVIFLFRYTFGLVSAKKAEAVWREQIENFRQKFGRNPEGLNTHEHLHFFPAFFTPFLHLTEEYHIPYIRFSKHGLLVGTSSSLVGRILSFFSKQSREKLDNLSVETSDYLVSLDWHPDLATFLEGAPSGTVEIIAHPERPEESYLLRTHF